VFNGLRYIVRTGNQWRFMPGDLPPWAVVYQQTQRWMRAGVPSCFMLSGIPSLRGLGKRDAMPGLWRGSRGTLQLPCLPGTFTRAKMP
jgi:Putative transposase of IS4/5 family (DUF4096)